MLKNKLVFLTDQSKKYILLGVLFRELELIARTVSVFQIGDLLYAAIRGEMTENLVYRVLIVLAICFALQATATRFAALMQARSAADLKRSLREKIYDKIMQLGISYREKISLSEIISMNTDGVRQIESFYESFLPQLIFSAAAPVTLFVLMSAAINFRASLVLLLYTVVMPAVALLILWAAKSVREKYQDNYSELTQCFMENLRGLTTLKLYRADDIKAEEMDREAENHRTTAMRMFSIDLAEEGTVRFLALLGCLFGIMVGISEYIYGTFSMTGCIMIIILAWEYYMPVRKLCSMFQDAGRALEATDQIQKFLNLREPFSGTREMNVPRVYSETEEVVLANMDLYERPRFLKKSAISYTLSDVHFSYGQGREILHGVDMVLPPESFIALIGPSGCGKSTLADILCGKLKNYKGEIKVGCEGRSMNLYDIREAELLSHVVLVRIASHIFKGTIEDNLRIAKKDAEEQELLDALDAVNLLPFIRAHEGLETRLEAGGTNLSAGESQRLAIARALLKDAEVLIFDESTSNIDADSEESIMNVIRELARRKTVLLVSHRLSNVADADCIYVMDNGLIRESGTHEELLARKGIYNQLYSAQKTLEDYKADEEEAKSDSRQILELSGAVHADDARDSGFEKIQRSLIEFANSATFEETASEKDQEKPHRNILVLLGELTGLMTPGLYFILASSLLGAIGSLCLASIPVIAGNAVLTELSKLRNIDLSSPVARYFQFMAALAFLTVAFHAAGKYLSRHASYGILAQIRHDIYASLRKLAPSKFEMEDKADLILVLTDDIEKLDNLYVGILGPILASLMTAGILTAYCWRKHAYAGLLLLAGFLLICLVIPLLEAHFSSDSAAKLRECARRLRSFLSDQLDGIDETLMYDNAAASKRDLTIISVMEDEAREFYTDKTGVWKTIEGCVIYLCSFGMFFLTLFLHTKGLLTIGEVVACTLLEVFSFQTVEVLTGNLSVLAQSFASGERILRILEDRPSVLDISEAEGKLGWDGYKRFHGAEMSRVSFAYDKNLILRDFTILLWPKQLIGIHGPTGSGKSTVLKLLLRFWDVDEGSISICGEDIRHIATRRLRDAESYMAQDTVIFHDSIANNIAIGKPGASRVEIIRAAKKAALHDFILSLPRGYDTLVDEYENRLSDGERKRIGIARAFLHNAPLILLDEPSGNLDSLNEGMILKALVSECKEKTIVIASTRKSAMRACDTVFEMKV